MRMLGTCIDLELLAHLASERVLGEHALDGVLDDALGMLLHCLLEGLLTHAAGITRDAGIHLVGDLGASHFDLVAVDDDYEIARINMRRVGRLVLAAQNLRNGRGKTTQGHVGRIDQKPLALDFAGLRIVGLHVCSSN